MRITLKLDDDIADALKEKARGLDMPFEQVVNDTLRRGLSMKYSIVPNHSALAPGVDPLKLNQLNDQLEVEAFIKKSGAS